MPRAFWAFRTLVVCVRISGNYKATFTGDMKYTLMSDNGYTLIVNGDTIEVLYRQHGFGLKFVRYITNKENKQ